MRFQIVISILSILLFPCTLRGNDNIILENFNGTSGLMQCRCISQDDEGKMWFGTDKQLFSFDGYEIEQISNEGSLIINCIHIEGNRILFGSNNGLHVYNADKGNICHSNIINNSKILSIIECNSTLFVASNGGVYILEPDAEEYNSNCFFTGTVSSMTADGNNILIATNDGIISYSTIDKKLETVLSIPFVKSTIYADEENIWVGSFRSLFRISKRDKSIERLMMPMPKCISRDNENRLLIGTDRGLYRYDPVSKENKLIHKSIVWDFYTDKHNNIWMASDNGLLMMRQMSLFKSIIPQMAVEEGVYNKILLENNGRLWLGGLSGLIMIEDYDKKGSPILKYTSQTPQSFIPHNKIRNIRKDAITGEIHIATDVGIMIFNEHTKKFDIGIRANTERTFYYDILSDRDNYWLGTFSGLFNVNKGGELLERYTIDHGLSSNDIPSIARDKKGNVWMLTRDQNIHILKSTDKEIVCKDFSGEISKPYASCLTSDIDENIWIGISNRIVKASEEDGEIKMDIIKLNASESVENYSITDIGESILACTSEGLFCIHKNDLSVQNLNTHKTYVCAAYDKNKDVLIFSGPKGVDIISKSNLPDLYPKNAAKIAITRIVVNGSYEVPYAERKSMDLKMPHNYNSIRLYVSDFNYSGSVLPKFSYRLTGKRTNWQETVSSNSIMIPDMKPGNYTLLISGADDFNSNPTELKIRIRQPWYNSTPMLICYLLFLTAIIILISRFSLMKQNLALQKQQQDNIIEQSKYKEDFFISVAHEFKTPLSLIIAPLSKLIRETSNQNHLYSLQLAQNNAIKLNALIHKTLDYYNAEKGVVNSLITTEVEFVEFARSIFLSYQENYKDHEFIFSSSQDEMVTYLDIVKMETILNNLLSNACKYTPAGGSIILSLEKISGRDEIMIKMSDTGIGIPQEELPFVFQKYFESSRSKGGNYNSTGVGLSIIKRYVEMHKGSVNVDSDSMGTTFTIVIPCLTENTPTVPIAKKGTQSDNNKPLVVIIDDNIQICKFIESVLSEKYRCISSHNGKSGLKLCTDLMPDLIISDVMMPVMDGLEMCQRIREIAPIASTPIILLTAKGDNATEKASIELNIEAFISKPFDISTLTGRVDQLVGNKRRMEQSLRYEIISNPLNANELSQDEKYLKKVTQLIEDNLDDAEFNVSKLCALGDFNEKQLYRKLKQFTGMSVVEYIRSIRLKKAAILLKNGKFTVSEVMYTVGFSNASYFSRSFQAVYGKTPSEYMKHYKNQT